MDQSFKKQEEAHFDSKSHPQAGPKGTDRKDHTLTQKARKWEERKKGPANKFKPIQIPNNGLGSEEMTSLDHLIPMALTMFYSQKQGWDFRSEIAHQGGETNKMNEQQQLNN